MAYRSRRADDSIGNLDVTSANSAIHSEGVSLFTGEEIGLSCLS